MAKIKMPGDSFGATISVKHKGAAIDVDFGFCLHYKGPNPWLPLYHGMALWIVKPVSIGAHRDFQTISKSLTGIWSSPNPDLESQPEVFVCVAPTGTFSHLENLGNGNFREITNRLYWDDLREFDVILVRKYTGIYENGAGIAEFDNISATFS